MEEKVCTIYDCCTAKKNYKNCGKCNDLPCKTYIELKDPNISQEEHNKTIKDRVERLYNDK